MPVSQTVFINIVVKGGGIDVRAVSAPMKEVQAEAAKTQQAVESSFNAQNAAMTKAQKEELAFIQHTAKAEDQLRYSQAANIEKMKAAEVSAIQKAENEKMSLLQYTAKQENTLRAKQDAEAIRAIHAQKVAMDKAEKDKLALMQYTAKHEDKLRTARLKAEEEAAKRGGFLQQMAFGGFGEFFVRQINTLVKALTSMIGVMAMFTLFITIPEMLAKGFLAVASAAIKSADEVKQLQISLAALMTSTMEFGGTVEEQFKKATVWSRAVYLRFVELSTQSLALPSDLNLAYQAFLAGGGAQMVKSLDEQVQLTGLLANAIITLVGREQASKQMFSETRAVMEGALRQGSQLSRFIQGQVGDMQKWIQHIKTSKDGLAEFQKVLKPFEEAGKEAGKTFSGLLTSIKGFAEALNAAAMQGGAFKTILGFMTGIRDALGNAIKELVSVKSNTDALSPSTQAIVNAFSNVAALIQMSITLLLRMLGIVVDINNPAAALEQTTTGIMVVFASIYGWIKSTIDFASALATIFNTIYDTWVLIVNIIMMAVFGLKAMLFPSKENFAFVKDLWRQYKENLAEVGKTVKELPSVPAKLLGVGEYAPSAYKNKLIKDMQDMAADAAKALRAGFNKPTGEQPTPKPRGEEMQEGYDKLWLAYQKIITQLKILQAEGDKFLEIEVQQAEKALEIQEKFKAAPKLLQMALAANELITKELIKQEDLRQSREAEKTLKSLNDQLYLLENNNNELAKIEIDRANQQRELEKSLKHQNDALAAALDLNEKIHDQMKLMAQIKIWVSVATAKRDYKEDIQKRILDTTNTITETLSQAYNEALGKVETATETTEAKIALMWQKLVTDVLSKFSESETAAAAAVIKRLTDAFNKAAGQMRTAAAFKDFISDINMEIMYIKELTESLDTATEAYIWFGGSMQDIGIAARTLGVEINTATNYLNFLKETLKTASGEEAENLKRKIEELTKLLNAANMQLMNLPNTIDLWVEKLDAGWKRASLGAMKFGQTIKLAIQTVAVTAFKNLGAAFRDMFSALFSGDSAIKAIRKFLGEIVMAVGEQLVAVGVANVASGLSPWASYLIGIGLKQIAVGAATIAAGAALAGTGGGAKGAATAGGSTQSNPKPIYVDNNQIAAQQGMARTMDANTVAVVNLNNEISRLSKENGDVLVTKAVTKSPEKILQPLANKISRSYDWQKRLGGAAVGANV